MSSTSVIDGVQVIKGSAAEFAAQSATGMQGVRYWVQGGNKYESDGSAWKQISASGADMVSNQAVTGIENPTSSITSVLRGMQVANRTIVNKQTTVVVGGSVAANDTWLLGIEVVKALSGTCVISGFADDAGAAQNITLPIGTPPGEYLKKAAKNTAGQLTVLCSTAGDALNVIIHSWPAG